MAVIVEGNVVAAPIVRARLGDCAVIYGLRDQQHANDVVRGLQPLVSTSGKQAAAGVWPPLLDSKALVGAWLRERTKNENGAGDPDYELMILHPDGPWAQVSLWGKPEKPSRIRIDSQGPAWECYQHPEGSPAPKLIRWTDADHTKSVGYDEHVAALEPGRVVFAAWAVNMLRSWEYRRCDPSQWQNLTTALARTAAPRLDPYPPQENVTWPGPLNPSRLVGTWFQRRENEPSPFLILRADRFWAEGSLSGTPNDPTGVVVHRSGRRWDLRRNGAPWSDTVLAFDDSAVPRSIASLDPSHLNFDTDPILRGVLVSSYDRCDATAATSIERAAAAAGPWALGVAAGTEDDAAKRRIRELVYVLRHSAGFSRVDEWSAAMKELAEIGRPAVPDLAAELDRTSNDGTMRQIGFVLRVIRDPRAVPALIRALPRTALASSDFGAGNWRTLFGNEDVHNFMLDHQLESPRGPDFTWNRAVTQITYALEGITGHQEGHAALSAVPRSDDPDEVRRVKAIRSQEAQQWQQWWDAHHAELATADELASLGTASTDEQIERAGIARFGPVFPTGAAVHLGPIVESVMYNQGLGDDKPPCLDFDTGKMYQFPKGLPETTPWLNENGIDAFAIRTNNGSYTVYGQDTHAWRVDAGLWNNLEEQLRGGRLALPSTVHGEFGWSAIWGGYPVTFLFTTRAGGRGIVQFVGENEEPPALRIRYRMVVDDGWPAGDGTEDRDETNAGDTSAASEKNDDALAELSGLPVRGYDLPPLLPEYPAPPLASRMDGSQRRDVSQLAQAAARLKALKQIEDRARSGEPWQSQGGRAAVRFLEGKGARIELRQAADGRWSVDRAGRTAPRAGNDAQHFSTKGDARIEVRQTPEGHEQVARLVDQMWTDHLNRDQRMVSVESRFILTDGDDAAAVDRWLAANAPDKVAETPAPDASHDSRVLDAGGAEAFLELVNARKSAVTTFAPRLTLWNGQLSYICDATMNVQEIARLDRPGRPRELVRLDRCGLLQVRPTVSDDPRSVRLDLHPRLVQDAEKEGPADPASPLLLVADLSASLNVPGGATVVLRVPVPVQRLLGVTDPPAEEAGEAAYDEGSPLKAVFGQAPQDGAKVLWLIVKPQVIAEDKAAADQAAPGDEAVEGRVVDPDGNPVAGAEVLLLELGPHYGNCEYPLEQKAHVRTVTGTTGTFSVPAAARPASAVFQTVVRKEGFGLGHKWNLGFPTADGKPHRIRLTRQSVLGGTVVDEQDRPIAGAEVLADLYFVKDTSSVDIQGGIRGLNWLTARTDDDGRFAFSNIPEGCWAEFVVRAPGRATVATVLDEPPLKYRAGQTDIRLVLPPEGRIEGVAVDKATGKPVADEQFVISSHDANERPGTLARTDGSGRFVFTGLAAGTWTIRGASSAIWQGAQTAEWVAAPCFVQVKSGGTASARIELEPGGLLDVTLTDAATGKPFRGVVMLIGGVREDQAGDDAPDNHRTDREKYVMVTGLDGTVRMRLMPGHYDVIATKSLERLSGEPQYGPESGQVEIDVKAGQTQRVSLRMQRLADAARSGSRRSAALGGRVTDPEGRPVAGATVHLLPWFTQPVAQTDADGAFTLPLGARRNDLTLVARSADGKLAAAVDVTADAETIDVRLAPALAISGLVLDEQGRPVAGAPLTFIPISAALRIPVSYAESVTGEDGRFDVGALPADHDYRLTINHGGPGECVVALGIARTSVRQVDARDGRIDAGTVTLPAADRSVAGVVVDAHGQPVPGVTVWSSGNSTLDAADGQPFRKAAADEAGRFRVENVCPGGLDLWVDDKDAGLSGRTSARVDREAKDPDDVRIVVNVRTSSPRVVRLDDVRITLHPTQPKWQPGETPTFTAEIENTGQRRLAAVVGPQPQGGHLQVDGRWYPVTFGDGDMVTGVTLEPGSTVKDVPVHPSPAFTRFAILQPGVRKLRLGMLIQDPQMPPPYSVTVAEGELVEIEIPPQDEGSGNDARDGGKTGDAAQPGAKTEVGTGQGLLELRLVAEDTGRPIAGTRIVVWLEILSLADKAAAFPVDTMAQMTTHGLARVIRRAAETDGSGLASFRLPAGQYVLNSADASGDEKYGRRRIDRNVAIVEGQTERLEVELARPPETPPVAIVVSDPDGRPAAGVKVSLMAAGKSAEATTDAAGRAELPVPSPLRKDRPEEVIVWARVADSNLAGLAKLGEPAVPLSVQLAPGLVLDGTVVDLEGRPVAEAVVRVSIEKPRGGAIGEARTRTDAQGRYEIRQGLPVGQRYFLHVNVIDNWSSSPGTGPTGRFGGAVVSLGQRKPGESHIEVDKVVLEPADCSVSGIVVDADGKPVPGVDVCVSSHWPPAAAVEAVQPRRLVSTDQQGRFRLEGLCKGSVHLRGLWSGLGALASKAPPAGGAMSSVKLTLTGDAEDVRMILRPAEEVFPAMKPRPADQPGQADPPAPPPAPANAATPPVQTRTVRDTRTEDVARQFLAAAEANDMEQAAQLSAGEFDGWLPAESVDALQLDERPFGWTSKYLKSAVGEMRHGVLSRCSAAYLVTHDLRVEGNVTGVWLGVAEKPLVLLVLKKTWAGWRMATFDEAWPDHGRQLAAHVERVNKVDAALAASWGEAVEGVQVRLWAEKTAWAQGDEPDLFLGVRNVGTEPFRTGVTHTGDCHQQVEVDGQWYGWAERMSPDVTPALITLEPGQMLPKLHGIGLHAGYGWALPKAGGRPPWAPGDDSAWGRRLMLAPGKHTIRVLCKAEGKTEPAVSNAVEIEVLPLEDRPPAAGSLEQMSREVLRQRLQRWARNPQHGRPDERMADPDNVDQVLAETGASADVLLRRVATARLLEWADRERVRARLIELAQDEDSLVKLHATSVLACLGDKQNALFLRVIASGMQTLTSSEFERNDAAWTLLAMGNKLPVAANDHSRFFDSILEQVRAAHVADREVGPEVLAVLAAQLQPGPAPEGTTAAEPRAGAATESAKSAADAPADGLAWGEPVDGIRCAVRPLQPAYAADEDILLEVRYQNVSEQPVTVCVRPDPFNDWTRLEVLNARGVADARGMHGQGVGPRLKASHLVTLAPGQTTSLRHDLPRTQMGKVMLEPGRYHARVTINVINGMWDHLPGLAELAAEQGVTLWKGIVASGLAPLTIVAAPDEPWGEASKGTQAHPRKELPGRVLAADGRPVAGAEVRYYGNRTATTDADGSFVLEVPDTQSAWTIDVLVPMWVRPYGMLLDPARGYPAALEIRLPPTRALRGQLVDDQGRPVTQASISAGTHSHGDWISPPVRQWPDGRFDLAAPIDEDNPRDVIIGVEAPGLAPQVVVWTDEEAARADTQIVLDAGRPCGGVIVDARGEPVAGARIVSDYVGKSRFAKFERITDQAGRFDIEYFPSSLPVAVTVFSDDRIPRRGVMLTADKTDHRIVMLDRLAVRGRVTDARTGEAVEAFIAVPGRKSSGTGGDKWYWDNEEATTGSHGDYTVTFGEGSSMAVRIEAPGYVPCVSRTILPEESDVRIDLALESGRNVEGTVVDGDGKPLADALVMVATADAPLYLSNETRDPPGGATAATTGADGRFTLPPQAKPFLVVVQHETGYALVPGERVLPAGKIAVGAWARVEGDLILAGAPAAGEKILIQCWSTRPILNDRPFVRYSVQAETDAQGRFVAERVAADNVQICHWIQHRRGAWETHRHVKLQLAPGETARVNLGANGRTITGRLQLPEPLKGANYWPYANANILRSQEGAYVTFDVNDDGSFRVEGVPPGEAWLRVTAYEPQPNGQSFHGREVAALKLNLSIPETPADDPDKPLDLGQLKLESP
ncbi:MAG: carboxypeptidase regulatory-like domain-containing protein [Planctomycetes bacterium]|nr:carboxypeptidase regulatory-like domain-containing protein [Planctomycetota bacterium]